MTTPLSVRIHAGDGYLDGVLEVGSANELVRLSLFQEELLVDGNELLDAVRGVLAERRAYPWYRRAFGGDDLSVECDRGEIRVSAKAGSRVMLDLPLVVNVTFGKNPVIGHFSESRRDLRARISTTLPRLRKAIEWAQKQQSVRA